MSRKSGSLMGDIMAAAGGMETFTKAELRRLFPGVKPHMVNRTVDNLYKKGFLDRADGNHGVYLLSDSPPEPKVPEGQVRMWAVFKVRESYGKGVTARELQMLSEAGRTYASGYITFLRKQGLIEQSGATKHPDGIHRSPVYSLTEKGRAFRGTPHNRKSKKVQEAEERRRKLFDLGCRLAAILREDDPSKVDAGCLMAKIQELLNVPARA